MSEIRDITVEADHGREVTVRAFPGGDMIITSGLDDYLYLPSDQADALKTALDRVDDTDE